MISYEDFKLEDIGRSPNRWEVVLNNRKIAVITENNFLGAKFLRYNLQFKGQPQVLTCKDFNEVVHLLLASVNN